MNAVLGLLLAMLISCAVLPAAAAARTPTAGEFLPMLPLPAAAEQAAGSFTVRPGTPVIVVGGGEEALRIARLFIERVEQGRGIALRLHSGATRRHGIRLVIEPQQPAAQESYRLAVSPQGIEIRAASAAGLYYGSVTLWQLLTPDARQGRAVRVPALTLQDAPRFAWRGLMLDVARHYMPVEFIKQLIDWMSLHKLNTFHWHLSDDQGWRLQIAAYPRLTEVGASRGGAPAAYYTQAQVRDIVVYAAQRFITVVPEIDMPGHMQAAIAAYPWLGSAGDEPPVSTQWGVHPYLLNVEERTFGFVKDVLDEVVALFPGRYVHVGGDEAVKNQWRSSPPVQQRMHALGVADEEALQGYFMHRVAAMLQSHRRKLIGWDEIVAAGLPPEAAVMSWRANQAAVEAARAGHDVVMSPYSALYLDYLQSDSGDEAPGLPPVVSLADVYAYDPLPPQLATTAADHIIGVQANVWTERMQTPAQVEHAVFPRLAALSEIAWTPPARRHWNDFLGRLTPQLARYRRLGIGYAQSAFAARIDASPAAPDTAVVSLHNQAGWGELRYALNGRDPDARSPRYVQPLRLALPVEIRAAPFVGGEAIAAPTRRMIDQATLSLRGNDALALCSSRYPLRLGADRRDDGTAAAFLVDVLDPCWIYRQAQLQQSSRITVRLQQVHHDTLLGKHAEQRVAHPARTPHGELEIRSDRCDGSLLASVPLPGSAAPLELSTALAAQAGSHDLCLYLTGNGPDPLWVIDSVLLVPLK